MDGKVLVSLDSWIFVISLSSMIALVAEAARLDVQVSVQVLRYA